MSHFTLPLWFDGILDNRLMSWLTNRPIHHVQTWCICRWREFTSSSWFISCPTLMTNLWPSFGRGADVQSADITAALKGMTIDALTGKLPPPYSLWRQADEKMSKLDLVCYWHTLLTPITNMQASVRLEKSFKSKQTCLHPGSKVEVLSSSELSRLLTGLEADV